MGIARGFISVCLVLTLVILGGCGGGDSDTAQRVYYKKSTYYPKGPTRQFIIPDGDNTIQYFGWEGSPAQREAASRVIEAWMRARSAKNWRAFCHYMSRLYIDNLVTDARKTSNGKARTCTEAMDFFGALATGGFVNTMTGPIDSLRVNDSEGYAQYHGIHGVDWIVPLDKEHNGWRVAISAPINRRR